MNSTKATVEKYTCTTPNNEIVLYRASWCGACKSMYPEWEKFKTRTIPNVKIPEVQCDGGNEALCFDKGIEGYPTILFTRADGHVVPYEGQRTDEAIYAWVQSQL